MVFAKIQDTHRAKVTPNAVCRSMQEPSVGRPMKVREHRKHRVREKSSRKLSSELLAFTRGVWRYWMKMDSTASVNEAPSSESTVRRAPMVSAFDRNSITFGTQRLRSSADQYSSEQRRHSAESEWKLKRFYLKSSTTTDRVLIRIHIDFFFFSITLNQ